MTLQDEIIVTPALLAVNRNLGEVPDNVVKKASVSLTDRYRYQQRIQKHFWSRWLKEYLPGLTIRQKWLQEMSPLKTNDNLPRGKWRLGKVEKTFGWSGWTNSNCFHSHEERSH